MKKKFQKRNKQMFWDNIRIDTCPLCGSILKDTYIDNGTYSYTETRCTKCFIVHMII